MSTALSGFSEDGQWWWDGRKWAVVPEVVIPDLPSTPPESVKGLMRERDKLGEAGQTWSWIVFATQSYPLDLVLWLPFLYLERRAFREFRRWTLDQLAAATAYLLGPNEPMVAGETTLYRPSLSVQAPTRDLAVVITAAHVLVLRFDRLDGQPRWVALAARAHSVQIIASGEFMRAHPTIEVRRDNERWSIIGTARVMQHDPVVAAWRAAQIAR